MLSLHIALGIALGITQYFLHFDKSPKGHGDIKLQCSRGTQVKTVRPRGLGRMRLVIGVHIQKATHPTRAGKCFRDN